MYLLYYVYTYLLMYDNLITIVCNMDFKSYLITIIDYLNTYIILISIIVFLKAYDCAIIIH